MKTFLLLILTAGTVSARVFPLDILHTNDVHGGIVDRDASFLNPDFPPGIGGGAWLATYVDSVRAEVSAVGGFCLLLDAGDIYQGTPTGNHDLGESVIDWMNRIGYDAMTPGNHDFDDGVANALRLAGLADFPVLSCNIVEAAGGATPEPLEPWVLMDFGGVSVAIIGLSTPDTYGLVDPARLEGYLFTSELEAVLGSVGDARDAGADIVILLSHLGQPSEPDRYVDAVLDSLESGRSYTREFSLNNAEISTLVPGIDLIVSGHTHYGLRQPWVNPVTSTIVVQGYANGTGVGHLRLLLDSEAECVVGWECPRGEEIVNLLHDEFWPDPASLASIEGFRRIAEAGMDRVIGEAMEEIPRGTAEHPLGRLIADAMLGQTGADVALMNRGGVRASIPRGMITPRIVYEAVPFEEDLYLVELTGAQLRQVLETGMQGRRRDMEPAGFTAVRNQALPDMSKIESLLVDGEDVDSAAVYTLVTTGYLAEGNVGYEILRLYDAMPAGITLFDAVVQYLETLGPLTPDNSRRVTWIDSPR
jgi:5'-nucleotidase / UDP-sugar diphosphatase